MGKVKLNETPLRTSRNFLINNVKLDDLDIPEDIEVFRNVEVSGENYVLREDTNTDELTYGINKDLDRNVLENANSKIKLKVSNGNIRFVYCFDDDNLNLMNVLEIEAEGKCDLIIEYRSNTNKKCFHNGIIKLFAMQNSDVHVTIINFMNNISENLESIENMVEKDANVDYTIVDIGGRRSIQNYYSNIIGNCAKNDLKTVYLAENDELKDINYIVDVRGEKSAISIDVQGALKDVSKKNFKGTIDFKKGCKKAKGSENEYCMILSDKAKSIALPMLLCTEEDVEGNHSAASRKGRRVKAFLYYV